MEFIIFLSKLDKEILELLIKAKYIVEENKIEFQKLNDNEIIKELIKIKGVGLWTAEMFLIFILFKINIFSKGDLALINSVKKNYQIENLDDLKLERITQKWEPYKSIASLLLWKSIEEKVFYN